MSGSIEQADFINEFAFDRHGRVWCTTDAGLIVGEPAGDASFRFRHLRSYRAATRFAPAEATNRTLWIGMGPDLVVLDGTSTAAPSLNVYTTPFDEAIVAIVEAESGSTVIVITTRAVFEFNPAVGERWRRLKGSPPDGTTFYAATRAFGALWMGAEGRVLEVRGDAVNGWRIGRGLPAAYSAAARRSPWESLDWYHAGYSASHRGASSSSRPPMGCRRAPSPGCWLRLEDGSSQAR